MKKRPKHLLRVTCLILFVLTATLWLLSYAFVFTIHRGSLGEGDKSDAIHRVWIGGGIVCFTRLAMTKATAQRVGIDEGVHADVMAISTHWMARDYPTVGQFHFERDSMALHLWFPAWLIPLLLVVVALIDRLVLLPRQRREKQGLCPSCGYDLRATPDRCPECGTPASALG